MPQSKNTDLYDNFKVFLASAGKNELKRPNSEELRAQEEVRALELKNNAEEQEQKLKARIFTWVQTVVSLYLLFVAVIIICSMCDIVKKENALSDQVLIALLTTTTINVLGLPYLIIRALFKSKKPKSKPKSL